MKVTILRGFLILAVLVITTGCGNIGGLGLHCTYVAYSTCTDNNGTHNYGGPGGPGGTQASQTVIVALGIGIGIDPNYGAEMGFTLEGVPNELPVILTVNQTVQFVAADGSGPHTAAYLGPATAASAPWPAPCATIPSCVSTTASPANSVINAPGFTTGAIGPFQASQIYVAPSPGFWMFGCHYHYDSKEMRTVIVSE